jgi:hypothetical protein
VLSPEVVLHDRCNLVALPIVGGLVLAGLLGAVDTLLVRKSGVVKSGWRAGGLLDKEASHQCVEHVRSATEQIVLLSLARSPRPSFCTS